MLQTESEASPKSCNIISGQKLTSRDVDVQSSFVLSNYGMFR